MVPLSTGPRVRCVESGDPSGEPIVFVHGWPDSAFSFSRVMPLLPETMRAVAFDQRGFGDSDRPESAYTIPEMAADVIALLDALRIERTVLVGHSFGSFVARQVAIAQSQRVTGLVLIGTGFKGGNDTTRGLQRDLRDLPDPIPDAFAREFQSSTLHRPVPPDFFEGTLAESLKLPPRLWRLTMDGLVASDDTTQLARIEAPVLLLWGDHDALFSRSEQQQFLAALPSARLKVYADTGHCPNWEIPDQVAADIADFASDVLSG